MANKEKEIAGQNATDLHPLKRELKRLKPLIRGSYFIDKSF
ncbi:MAG: hypothetical protein ACXV8W_08655 [Methylobacter sp.]